MPSSLFTIDNDSTRPFSIHVEPEGFVVILQPGEHVTVRDEYDKFCLTVRMGIDDRGATVLSIWPGDGFVGVERDGIRICN